jgi:hypothetical protein
MSRRHRTVMLLVTISLVVLPVIVLLSTQKLFWSIVEQIRPDLVPSSAYIDNLGSSDPDVVRETLAHLAARKDCSGVAVALPLLQSNDDYIWLNAALYTGSCGRHEATPYLIKALRHTAWRADADVVMTLKALTGQNFGSDFSAWQSWWLAQHPSEPFDWTSHLGFRPRVIVSTTRAS